MSLPAEDLIILPASMRAARRWLVWKSEPTADGRKPRKVPYYVSGSPRHGALDSPQDQAQLATFEDALAVLPGYSGLGFALGPDGTGNCWQGVDLDSLSQRPELQLLAEDAPGYTETSPSGDGIHAIGYGRPFAALGANGTGIEAYSSGRYFTVTGDNAGLHEPCDLANWVNATLRPRHSVRPTTTASVAPALPPATIHELRSALLSMRADDRDLWVANGQRLKKLGEAGRELWLTWSATSDKFDPADAARVWDSLKGDNTGYQAVFAAAQAHGWVNPLSGAASVPTPTAAPAPSFDLPALTEADITAAKAPHPHAFQNGERGLFPEGEVTVIGAPGREGKTTLVMAVALHYALGLPLSGMVPTECRPVLIYSAEDDRAQYARKAGAQWARLATSDRARFLEHLLVPDLHGPELAAWRELVRFEHKTPVQGPAVQALIEAIEARASKPGLIVFETASTLSDADEDNPGHKAMIAALKRIAKATHSAVVLVHHTSQAAAHNLPDLNISEADIRGGTTLVNNARQTHLVVNLGSAQDPHPETDARTLLKALVAPRTPERITALICLSSSKCADPAPLFFRWEDTDWGPRMVAVDPPAELRNKSWRGLKAQLAGVKAEIKTEKRRDELEGNVRLVTEAATRLAERGEQPTASRVSAECGRSPGWAKQYLQAAAEEGLLAKTTELVPRTKGPQDIYRPVSDRRPWADSSGDSSAAE